MKQLKKLQNTFQDYVLKPNPFTSTSWVSAEGKSPPEKQLSIYSYAYHARLEEVLANDYPAILVAIGEKYFHRLAKNYIEVHPSKFFNLRDFGAGLANFIANLIQQQTMWQEMPWLYELAIFEWSLGQAFDAADDNLLSEEDMAGIAPEAWPTLKFKLHSSVQRLDLKWNIIEMWQALTAENPVEVQAKKEDLCTYLVWRENLSSHFRSMQQNEQIAFDVLAQAGDFSDICAALSHSIKEDEIPMHVASFLKTWINQGLISKRL